MTALGCMTVWVIRTCGRSNSVVITYGFDPAFFFAAALRAIDGTSVRDVAVVDLGACAPAGGRTPGRPNASLRFARGLNSTLESCARRYKSKHAVYLLSGHRFRRRGLLPGVRRTAELALPRVRSAQSDAVSSLPAMRCRARAVTGSDRGGA